MSQDTSPITRLREQLSSLHDRFAEAASAYRTASDILQTGLLPEISPHLHLEALRETRRLTVAALSATGERVGIEPLPEISPFRDANLYLERIILAIQEAERKTQLLQEARRVIEEVRALSHASDPDKLKGIHDAIRAIEEQTVPEFAGDIDTFKKALDPVKWLAEYSWRRNSLSDDGYDTSRQELENNYGRWLLRDLDRGRIKVICKDDEPDGPDSNPDEPRVPPNPVVTPTEADARSVVEIPEPDAPVAPDPVPEEFDDAPIEPADLVDSVAVTDRIDDIPTEPAGPVDGVSVIGGIDEPKVEPIDVEESPPMEMVLTGADAAPGIPIQGTVSNLDITSFTGNGSTSATSSGPGLSDSPSGAPLESETVLETESVALLPWRFIEQNYLGLAYYASLAMDQKDSRAIYPPSWLIRAAAIGPFIGFKDSHCDLLQGDLSQYDAKDGRHKTRAFNLLLATATISPALFAPNLTNAPAYLSHVETPIGMDALARCIQGLKEYCAFRLPLDPARLKFSQQGERYGARLQEEAEEWLENALSVTIKYQSATKIWRTWVMDNGRIRKLLQAVILNKIEARDEVADAVNIFSDPKKVSREIKLLLQPNQEIEGRARQSLIERAHEAAILGERWLSWLASAPKSTVKDDDRLAKLSELLHDNLPQAKRELTELRLSQPANPEAVAAGLLIDALNSLQSRMAGDTGPDSERALVAFFGPIVRLKIPLNDEGLPEQDQEDFLNHPDGLIQEFLRIQHEGLLSWESAFLFQAQRDDHIVTRHVISFARNYGESQLADTLEGERDRLLRTKRQQIQQQADETHLRLERAFSYGVLQTEDRDHLRSRIDETRRSADEAERFTQHHDVLREVDVRLAIFDEEAKESVLRRLEMLRPQPAPEDHARIKAILVLGDLHTANDYIERLSSGEVLPSTTHENRFDFFFPVLAEQIYAFLQAKRHDWTGIAHRLRSEPYLPDSDLLGPISLDATAPEQHDSIASVIETWFQSKQRHAMDESGAARVLEEIGFSRKSIEVVTEYNRTYFNFESEIPHHKQVIIPAYGSSAQGLYRILCVWNAPDEEELLSLLAATNSGRPLLVFYFGAFSAASRRQFAHQCRNRRHQRGSTALVIDDVLILYLLSVSRGSRLRALFECTLPFTVSEPYNAQASHVSPEMFYGRESELKRIKDTTDTSLLYGGRQLGKTALLHHAEFQFNSEPHCIARYIDLNAQHIGTSNKPQHVWRLIAEKMMEAGVIDATQQPSMRPKKLVELIRKWLDENVERRILLLLDETDRFFEYDSQQHYSETQLFKGLMEETQRRFKVVFAGLHNVYRSARDPNQPLHHLQDPICIGPLLDGKEKQDAAELVELPLKALGYRFESPDLISLILSQTNYYPSLIQLYCQQLLKDIEDPSNRLYDPILTPPYPIDSRQIRHSYEQHDLFKRIRRKFDLTIELDERYAVIAYSIAWAILENDKAGDDIQGFPVEWIRSECIKWWRIGFQGAMDERDIETLLDEMEGLGVLRRVKTAGEVFPYRYTLRSPNVLILLGSKEEIMQALLKERRIRPTYDPMTFRSPTDDGLLAPFTAQQTNDLIAQENGITLVFGTIASSLHRVSPYLQRHLPDTEVKILESCTDINQFSKWFDQALQDRKQDTVTLLVVPETTPWESLWIDRVQSRLNALSSRRAFAHVLFLGDADTAMRFVRDQGVRLTGLETEQIGVISLSPWHSNALYQWFSNLDPSVDEEIAKRISLLTANWPLLLEKLATSVQVEGIQWSQALDTLLELLTTKQEEILPAFGLNGNDGRLEILQAIAQWDHGKGVFESDLVELKDDCPEDHIRGTFRWAESMHLIYQQDGLWRLTAPLQQMLSI